MPVPVPAAPTNPRSRSQDQGQRCCYPSRSIAAGLRIQIDIILDGGKRIAFAQKIYSFGNAVIEEMARNGALDRWRRLLGIGNNNNDDDAAAKQLS